MNARKPLAEKSINSNIDQSLNFSFDKTTQKKHSKVQQFQPDDPKKKLCKEKEVIDLFLGQLKEHNHEKMIQMFGELRKQNKQKDQKNQFLTSQLEELGQQFKQVKLQYGRCLKEKTRLQQQLDTVSRQMSVYQTKCESQQRQMKELHKRQEENMYYKSQLFEANQKISEYKRKFLDPDETVENERQFKFKEMQWTYEMKLDECEQHIKDLQKENWQLGQIKIRHQTTIKKFNIQLTQANHQLQKLSKSSFNYSHNKSSCPSSNHQEDVQVLKDEIQALEKQLESATESYELRIVQLESEVELEKFKTQTYAEHTQTLQEKLNLLQNEVASMKQESFDIQQTLEKQQSKSLDLDTLVKEIIVKLKDLSTDDILIADYLIILNYKFQRISGGKQVTFLKNDTKDFVSITSRSKDSESYGPHSLTSKLNKELKLLKTNNKINTFQSESEQSCRDSFKRNCTSIKKKDEREYFSRNSELSEMQGSRSSLKNERFDSKILQERKEIENRIRQKYMKQKPKGFNEKSYQIKRSITQQLKELSFEQEGEKSPHFREDGQNRDSIYLTSEFQQ